MRSFIIKYRAKTDKIDKKKFDPCAENVPTYSWWKLGVHSTPYDLPKKSYEPKKLKVTKFFFYLNK